MVPFMFTGYITLSGTLKKSVRLPVLLRVKSYENRFDDSL